MDFGVFNLLQHRDRSKSPHQVIEEALSHTRLPKNWALDASGSPSIISQTTASALHP